MSKQFWGVIAVVVLIFVGIFALNGNKSNNSGKSNGSALSQHVEGKGSAKVALVEYGDYQCPFCGQFYPVVKQVQAEFNDQITFQFRNFPLTSIHQNAFAGARAAEAASMQNKFWEMHDALYETQQQWSAASDPSTFFKQYAKQLGLDVNKFQTDYASSRVNDTINADLSEGNKLKVDATPTFFLDGKKIEVGQATTAQGTFETLIKAAIAKKAGSASTTTTPDTGATASTPAQ